jgi:glucose/arabinose dehydrogenase
MGFADGGSGNDPLNLSQDLGSIFGKLLRIDPLGSNSANGKYGIPSSNPFVKRARALGEIYAYGLRNPQRFAWDSKTGSLFVADIGQNMVEEIDLVTAGANLGWNAWEGSFRFSGGSISLVGQRGDPAMTFPVAEYDHEDPVLQSRSAITMGTIYRGRAISQLSNLLLFGDNPSGEIFYVNADTLPRGGQDAIRRVLLHTGSAPRTFLAIIREKNSAMGQPPASRADLRFGEGPNGQVFLLNKRDGTVRVLVPDSEVRR